jgi:hypothetical protein
MIVDQINISIVTAPSVNMLLIQSNISKLGVVEGKGVRRDH